MNQTLVIVGAGGFGREVLQIVLDQNRIAPTWDCLGFLVDPQFPAPSEVHGLPVLGGTEWLSDKPDVQVVLAVGAPAARRRIARRISEGYGNRFAILIHPRAWLGENVACQDGTVICAGALLTTDIVLGHHAHVNLACTIGHDAVLEDYVTLSPGVHVSGNVRIGEGVDMGTGAVALPGVEIGAGSIIGAAACVTTNIPSDSVAVGVPAKPIKLREPVWHEAS